MSEKKTGARVLSWAGLVLFVAGLAILVLSVGASDYVLDEAAIQSLRDGGQIGNQTFLEEVTGLQGRSYDSIFALVDALRTQAAEAAEQGSEVQDWNEDAFFVAVARASSTGILHGRSWLLFWLSLGLGSLGALVYFLPRLSWTLPGIRNDGNYFSSMKNRGWLGIATGLGLIGFYVVVYFHPYYAVSWIELADPLSRALRDQPADQWFFYGVLYTLAILVMSVRFAINYRHSKYQLVRTASVSFFQLGFAFLIPAVLTALHLPSMDLKNAWPLNYGFFTDYNVSSLISSGAFGWALLVWGIALSFLLVPALAYIFGKRWYCSWVCGCGGLAETLGDPYRHLSDKSLKAWRIERWMVHGVLVLAVVMTGAVMADFFTAQNGEAIFGGQSWKLRSWYGFLIGSIFAGVVGTGFYPFMGNRVWCRFGCPLAAILGIVQRFKSRFRITTNGGQCISCGNCSTYCEMGIDVRWYAQRGQNVIRASCVGCGICSQVCPRGVLRLENGPEEGRFDRVSLIDIGQGRIEVS